MDMVETVDKPVADKPVADEPVVDKLETVGVVVDVKLGLLVDDRALEDGMLLEVLEDVNKGVVGELEGIEDLVDEEL